MESGLSLALTAARIHVVNGVRAVLKGPHSRSEWSTGRAAKKKSEKEAKISYLFLLLQRIINQIRIHTQIYMGMEPSSRIV